MKRKLVIIALALNALVIGLAGYAWYRLQPRPDPLPLPEGLVALDSAEGQALLARAIKADHGPLMARFEPQALASYCGVASGVIALGAVGVEATQADYFTEAAAAVRGQWAVTFGGMALTELAGLIAAHGAPAEAIPADGLDPDGLRALLRADLDRAGDVLLVNYERAAVGQVAGGHISPVSAYEPSSDRALILDTAAHRYPPAWVPVPALLDAMRAVDGSSGQPRGLVRVGAPAGG